MLKDTKSLRHNKASAWESRGFVKKKEGMHLTHPHEIVDNKCQLYHLKEVTVCIVP